MKNYIEIRAGPHATDALDHGMPVEEIQQMLGHVSIATTMIYADVSDKNTKMNHRKCII